MDTNRSLIGIAVAPAWSARLKTYRPLIGGTTLLTAIQIGCMLVYMNMIRIPLHFYRDHAERDLPTPVNHSRSKSYAIVAASDPALPELLSDAKFYASTMGDREWSSCPPGIVRSAAATVRAIRRAGQ